MRTKDTPSPRAKDRAIEHIPGTTLARIPLGGYKHRGLHAIVDADDMDLVSPYAWHARKNNSGGFYVSAYDKIGPRRYRLVWLHRLVMRAGGDDPMVDHIDRDGLNNSKSNLRFCTRSQNAANREYRQRRTKSRFKGVVPAPKGSRWIATVGRAGHLGYFATEEEAGRAYDAAARERYGEFALTNEALGLFDPEAE